MRYLSLFSGIEAASVAWEPLGWTPIAFAEILDFPNSVLRERFPGVPNVGDVALTDWHPYRGSVDVLVGGSPCTSYSIGGKREGLDDPRGRLVYEFVRAVRDAGPRWFIFENVPGILSQDSGRSFGALLREMGDLGYGLSWRVLDARHFGVPTVRRRVFLVGGPTVGCSFSVLHEPEDQSGDPALCGEPRPGASRELGSLAPRKGRSGGNCLNPWDSQSRRVFTPDGPSPTLCSAERRENLSPFVFTEAPDGSRMVRKLTPLEYERCMGFEDGWTDVPGATDAERYKALGNSMAVPVMRWIGERIDLVDRTFREVLAKGGPFR